MGPPLRSFAASHAVSSSSAKLRSCWKRRRNRRSPRSALAIRADKMSGAAAPSMAADLGVRPVARAPVYAPNDWSGFYIGAHAGYGWGHQTRNRNVTRT
jgi:hypothetical protein